jgi:DMSO/TMAO reductase YedYZ molybdopterin-dependent catalytic subunit
VLPELPATVAVDVADMTPFVTPNADFYRIDTALVAPQVRTSDYTLRIHGMVDDEIELSFEDLLRREMVERDITLTCVSNEVGGRYVGNARWLGTRLDDLLREAGVQPGADQVVGRSADGFECGFPVADAMDGRDALVVVGMNGEPLPVEHGFPVRLVVPGLYGYVSATKWLRSIELTRREDVDGYWVPLGWAKDAPILTQSRIDAPRNDDPVPAGDIPVAGVAWAPDRGIAGVEVRIDDGEWRPATISQPVSEATWVQWLYTWIGAAPGRHSIDVRATDGTGEVQTDQTTPPAPDGARGHHRIFVNVG